MSKIRVGVLEQHNIDCLGLCEHLSRQTGVFLVGTYNTFGNTLRALQQQRLDVLMIGHLMDDNPLHLVRILNRCFPLLKVLVLLDYPDSRLALELQSLGAHGVMSKTQPLAHYIDALRSVARGEYYALGEGRAGLHDAVGSAS